MISSLAFPLLSHKFPFFPLALENLETILPRRNNFPDASCPMPLFLNITRVRFQHFLHVKCKVLIPKWESPRTAKELLFVVVGKVIKKTRLPIWPTSWSGAIGGSPLPPLCFEQCTLLAFPMQEEAQGQSLEIVMWWHNLHWVRFYTQLRQPLNLTEPS